MYKISRVFLLIVLTTTTILGQTEFSYQGALNDGGQPANANYDFEFRLFAVASGGSTIATQQRLGVTVSAGVFTVQLDFGSNFPGAARYLEIAVKPAGSPSPFTTLTPRRLITTTPYAIRSTTAGLADSAATAATATLATNATQLGGSPPSDFVRVTDPRLTDARPPTSGSTSYIQNTAGLQGGANFNISGSGTAGGTLTANAVNVATEYRVGGSRVLGVGGNGNIFVGLAAGVSNSTGQGNSFFGTQAGNANSTGGSNSYFGESAGRLNTDGGSNSFFGANAGEFNTTGGNNTFVGYRTGIFNTTGFHNSFYGGFTGSENTTGRLNSFFGASAGRFNTTGSWNAFFGYDAGLSNTAGERNSFFGYAAGLANRANDNAFFGAHAGDSTTTGDQNSFFGSAAGASNTTGTANSFFGKSAGEGNIGGLYNSFFGYAAGFQNANGSRNALFGFHAGLSTNADENSFFGNRAGGNNTTGTRNVFVGSEAGLFNTSGSFNTVIGFNADAGAANLTNATAIGAHAVVSQSNSLVLGNNASVGIGTSAPKAKLDVRGGSIFIAQPNSLIITSPNGACWFITVNNSGALSTIPVTCP